MSENERGAYAPPTADAPLSFDARQPVRGARPFPITLILSGLVLLGLIGAIVVFYRSGVRAAGQAPQAVGTPVGELTSAPPADAQPQDPAAGLQIYHAEAGQAAQPSGAPQFAPPPEQPAARPIAAQPQPAPQVAAPPPPAPAPTAPVLRQALPSPEKPIATAPRQPVEHPVAVKPAPAPPKPAPAPPAAAKPAPLAAKAAGAASVQIGAVSSTALADKAWSEAVAVSPGMAAGKGKGVEKIDKDGHVLYRTAVTGFASRAQAAAFCAKLKAAGKACFVK